MCKLHSALVIEICKLGVKSDGRCTGSKTQNKGGLVVDGACNDGSSLFGKSLIAACNEHLYAVLFAVGISFDFICIHIVSYLR